MFVFAIAETGGEGQCRAFSTEAAAQLAADESDGYVLEEPASMDDDFSFEPTGIAAYTEIAGRPSKVWLVVCGDCGCTNGYLGAFADADAAETAAAEAEKVNETGFSFYVVEADVEY